MKVCGETHDKDAILDHRKQELDEAFQSQAGGSTAELRQQLVSELIHEFTNAITAVIGYSELALDGVEEPHRAREWLEKVGTHSRQLGSSSNKLIDLKRSRHGGQPRTPSRIEQERSAFGLCTSAILRSLRFTEIAGTRFRPRG